MGRLACVLAVLPASFSTSPLRIANDLMFIRAKMGSSVPGRSVGMVWAAECGALTRHGSRLQNRKICFPKDKEMTMTVRKTNVKMGLEHFVCTEMLNCSSLEFHLLRTKSVNLEVVVVFTRPLGPSCDHVQDNHLPSARREKLWRKNRRGMEKLPSLLAACSSQSGLVRLSLRELRRRVW